MTTTISRLYDNHRDAQQAVTRLEAAGVPHSDISLVANNSDGWFNTDKKVDRDRDGVDDRAEGAGKGAGIGAGVGGTAGLLAGLGLLGDPRTGPRGCSRLAGSDGGRRGRGRRDRWHCRCAYRGRRFGSGRSFLCRRRPPRRHAGLSASSRCGSFPPQLGVNQSAVNLRDRSAAWQKTGWKSFDPASKPYGAEDIRKERQLHGGGLR